MGIVAGRAVLAPGTWRSRVGEAAALAAEVVAADGSTVQEVIDALRAAIAALPAPGLSSGEAAALIAAQEGGRSYQARRALLELLLARVGDPDTYRVSGAVGPTVAAENLGARLTASSASSEQYLRVDVRKQDAATGAVTERYDPLVLARASVSGIADAGTGEVLNTAGQYRSFPLLHEGVPAAQSLRVGRNGDDLLVGFGAAEAATDYGIAVSAVAERVDAGRLQQALESLAPGTVAGAFLRDVPAAAYGAALPAAAGKKPGELFVVEGPPPALYWLKPGAAGAVSNRNRVRVVAQAGGGAAFAAWEHGFSAAATPENHDRFLGGLARRQEPGAANQYRYEVYLRHSLLAGAGIGSARDDGVKFYATVGGAVRAFKRFAGGAEVVYRGQRYVEYATDAIANLPAFADGTTYDLLLWTDSGGAAPLNYQPATRRAAGAWELVSRLGHVGRLIAKAALPAAPGAAGTRIRPVWAIEAAFSADWTTPASGHQLGDLNFKGCSPRQGIVIRTKIGGVVTSCASFAHVPGLVSSHDSLPEQTVRKYVLTTANADNRTHNLILEYWNRYRNRPWERLRWLSCGDALAANTTIEVLEWV